MGCAISCCAEGGPAWLSFVHGFTFVWRTSVLGGHASSLQRDNVALLRGRSNGCEKRLVSGNWRRKTERATLDRNYVLCILLEQGQRCSSNTRASPSTSLLNTFSLSVPSCGPRTSPVGHRQRVSRPARQPSPWSVPPCLILTPSAISPAPAPKHAASFSMLPLGKGRASNPEVLETHRAGGRAGFPRDGQRRSYARARDRAWDEHELADRAADAASDGTGPHQAGGDPGRPAHLGRRGLRMAAGGGGG